MLVLLDLGNVLYRIDFARTTTALAALPGYNGMPIVCSVNTLDPLFEQYDCGLISTYEFCESIRRTFGITAHDAVIINAWNALLVEPFDFALEMPMRIRKYISDHGHGTSVRVAVLSNISKSHLQNLESHFALLLDPQHYGVDALYYSCNMGLRKPDPEIFNALMEIENVKAYDVVFFDDSSANIAAARRLGINAVLVQPGDKDFYKTYPWTR